MNVTDGFADVLGTLDENLIRAYAINNGIQLPPKSKNFWCAVHKCRVWAKQLNMAERAASLFWLHRNDIQIINADDVHLPRAHPELAMYWGICAKLGLFEGLE